jgi:hypothetical protein
MTVFSNAPKAQAYDGPLRNDDQAPLMVPRPPGNILPRPAVHQSETRGRLLAGGHHPVHLGIDAANHRLPNDPRYPRLLSLIPSPSADIGDIFLLRVARGCHRQRMTRGHLQVVGEVRVHPADQAREACP